MATGDRVRSGGTAAAALAVVLALAGACAGPPGRTEQVVAPATATSEPAVPATAPVPPASAPVPSPAATAATPEAAPAPSVAAARTPQQLAAALTAAERTIRDPGAGGAAVRRAGQAQQLAYRRLARRPAWREDVIRALPAAVRTAARRNLVAGQRLRALVTPQDRLPDWRIVRPAPAAELLRHYHRAGQAHGIPWGYLAAIHLVETRMGRIRGTSTAGAQGPMQFMPSTWAAYGQGNIDDNGDAIMAAARYLSANGAAANLRRALWHYNHSDLYVAAVSAYARVMLDDPRTFRGYYHWQVYYATVDGDVVLPEGYGS